MPRCPQKHNALLDNKIECSSPFFSCCGPFRLFKPVEKAAKATKGAFTPKPASGSKQRAFKFGGPTRGPDLYDDGLTKLERKYIKEGKTNALAGAAKIRALFDSGKGF
jgi:hypothetical protein